MTYNDPTTDTQALINELKASAAPRELTPGRVYLVPDGDGAQSVIDTDMYADSPRGVSRDVRLHDVDSLTRYITAYADYTPEVWVSPGKDSESPTVTAVLDPEGWRHHIARLIFETTRDWRDWAAASDLLKPQTSFAEFVEDHLANFIKPDGATMLELAQSIRARTKSTFKSDRRLANGQVQLDYVESIDASAGKAGSIVIPDEIQIALQPTVGAKTYAVTGKFRFRLRDGDLALGVKVLNSDKVIESMLKDVTDGLKTALPDALILQGRI